MNFHSKSKVFVKNTNEPTLLTLNLAGEQNLTSVPILRFSMDGSETVGDTRTNISRASRKSPAAKERLKAIESEAYKEIKRCQIEDLQSRSRTWAPDVMK